MGRGGAIEIHGFDNRDNPIRRQLREAFTEDELYVRFLLRYDGRSIDVANGKEQSPDEGAFFVLWLDGSDGAVHNTDVPNIGLHVPTNGPGKGKNRFMVRIGSGNQVFTDVDVQGDRTYVVVGRLAKSIGGVRNPFDTFQIWVDPRPDAKEHPLATSKNRRGVNLVRWVGFATGRKTEPTDRIFVDELAIASTWESLFGLPDKSSSMPPHSAAVAEVNFARDVFPILKSRCFQCHAERDAESGVRLDVLEEVLGHTTGNPLVVSGSADESRLIELIQSDDVDEQMPPEGERLSDNEVAILRGWIDQGLRWDDTLLPSPPVTSDHWAFQPVQRPGVPKVDNANWVRNPIDAFVAAVHQQQKLEPSPPAAPASLARRLAFGLTGLPPTPEEVDLLKGTNFGEAYAQLAHDYLASPQYGERWARHWLDVARWAESNGHQHNRLRHHAWRYRDYVVRSFNADKPYDQFLQEQIAGDELNSLDADHLIATGFLAAARVSGNEMNPDIRRNDILVDIVNATGEGLLGLTLGCAQCHNHKFDPVSARDYYRFQAFFAKGQLGNYALPQATQKSATDGGRKGKNPPQTFGFHAPSTSSASIQRFKMRDIRYPLPYDPEALAEAKTYLLVRGEVDVPGPVVEPGWPAVFGRVADQRQVSDKPRTALAKWLTSRDNPLTARVWVNRLWHYHFGRGLVDHANDFGVRTPRPKHHALLDWLASELMDSGWSTKHIQRLIVTSSTYRQSSKFRPEAAKIDPENDWLWHYPPRRLEAEAIRDAVLAVSGELNLTRGGPSVPPGSPAETTRRTLYLLQQRRKLSEVQTVFDGASAIVSCGERRVSTVPLQPLYLLNNEFVVARAAALARRVSESSPADAAAQIEAAFRLALGRPPDDQERERAVQFVMSPIASDPDQKGTVDIQRRMVDFCHALLNLNEFIYLQ